MNLLSYESSNINWCETNYYVSNYICEFINIMFSGHQKPGQDQENEEETAENAGQARHSGGQVSQVSRGRVLS